MKLRFTKRAAHQIDTALAYVQEHSSRGAARLSDRILQTTDLLARHPDAGQVTDRATVRRMVLNPFPYLLFYRVTADEIVIMRFRHAARRPTRGVE